MTTQTSRLEVLEYLTDELATHAKPALTRNEMALLLAQTQGIPDSQIAVHETIAEEILEIVELMISVRNEAIEASKAHDLDELTDFQTAREQAEQIEEDEVMAYDYADPAVEAMIRRVRRIEKVYPLTGPSSIISLMLTRIEEAINGRLTIN